MLHGLSVCYEVVCTEPVANPVCDVVLDGMGAVHARNVPCAIPRCCNSGDCAVVVRIAMENVDRKALQVGSYLGGNAEHPRHPNVGKGHSADSSVSTFFQDEVARVCRYPNTIAPLLQVLCENEHIVFTTCKDVC